MSSLTVTSAGSSEKQAVPAPAAFLPTPTFKAAAEGKKTLPATERRKHRDGSEMSQIAFKNISRPEVGSSKKLIEILFQRTHGGNLSCLSTLYSHLPLVFALLKQEFQGQGQIIWDFSKEELQEKLNKLQPFTPLHTYAGSLSLDELWNGLLNLKLCAEYLNAERDENLIDLFIKDDPTLMLALILALGLSPSSASYASLCAKIEAKSNGEKLTDPWKKCEEVVHREDCKAREHRLQSHFSTLMRHQEVTLELMRAHLAPQPWKFTQQEVEAALEHNGVTTDRSEIAAGMQKALTAITAEAKRMLQDEPTDYAFKFAFNRNIVIMLALTFSQVQENDDAWCNRFNTYFQTHDVPCNASDPKLLCSNFEKRLPSR